MSDEKQQTALAKPVETAELVQQEQFSFNIEQLIAKAIDQNVPVETMERFLVMRDKLKAEWAKAQFDNAMAKFQGECPIIKKNKAGGATNAGKVAYYYAPLEEIVKQTKDIIAKNDLSYAIKSITKPDGVSVTVFVKHKSGHTEESNVEVPLGVRTGVMSAPQVVAAAITFASRYAFKNAFGIMTGDDDLDQGDGKEFHKPAATQPHVSQATTVEKAAAIMGGEVVKGDGDRLISKAQGELILSLMKQKGMDSSKPIAIRGANKELKNLTMAEASAVIKHLTTMHKKETVQ